MAYEETLARVARENRNVVVMTAENRAAIRGLPAKLGPRFVDVGICEQTMIGAAAGLALRGRVPVCHALATFLTMRAFEFIRTDVGIPGLPVKLVGAVPGLLSDGNGPTHQALEDIALMRGIPHMQVVCPADAEELDDALPAIVASPKPVYVRYAGHAPRVRHRAPFELGKAETLYEGDDVAILTYGYLLGEAEGARQKLEAEGLSTSLVNVRTLKPIDERAVVRAARESRLLVVLEDHFATGGLVSIVSEVLTRRQVTARLLPIAFDERWFTPGRLGEVLEHEGLTADAIARRVLAQWKS